MIDTHLRNDPILAPLVAARPGLRVSGTWDEFELVIRAILGQQITVPAATWLAGRLVLACGEKLAVPDRDLTHLFPTALQLTASNLAGVRMPVSRQRALMPLAAAIAADPLIFGPPSSLEDAVARLRSLARVGELTAQYIAMRALRKPDAFPAADVGLMRAMSVSAVRPSPSELLERAENWRPRRAYAALHLWTADHNPRGRTMHEKQAA
jgi:AraC family transcriptional regulator of adaptative response / DNA-3-methyladenine glycosylase II